MATPEELLAETLRKQKFTDEPGMLTGVPPAAPPAWQPKSSQQIMQEMNLREGPEGLEEYGADEEGTEFWAPIGQDPERRREFAPLNYARAFEQDQGTYQGLLQGQLPRGWVPLTSDIPTFEDWIAAQGQSYMPRGDNTPYYEYFKAHFQLPHYGSMSSLFRDLGSAAQPITEHLMDVALPGPLNKYAGILAPGNPESVARAAAANEWSISPEKLYGPTATSWDYIGGGELAEDPEMRAIGRQVGTAIGSYFTGGALAGLAGEAASAAGVTALQQPVVQAGVQGAAQGAVQAAMTGQNIFEGATRGAVTGGAGGGAVALSGIDDALCNAVLRGATQGATAAAMNGADTQQILEAAAMGAVSAYGSFKPATSAGQPMLEEAMRSAPSFESVTAGVPTESFTPAIMARTPDELAAITGEIASGIQARTPFELQSIMAATSPLVQFDSALATAGMLSEPPAPTEEPVPEAAPVVEPAPVEEPAPAPAAPKESGVELKQAAQYAKAAKQAYDLYNQLTGGSGHVEGFDIPRRTEGMSDEEYNALVGDAAVDYLGLDPDYMRSLGLVPGTPEYMAYIMERADLLIEQATGADPSILLEGESTDDLKAALRNLSEQEMQQLARALYVRGTLGAFTASSTVFDPFTGTAEQLGLQPGEFVAGDIAGAQRGYARSLERLARLPGAEFRSDLRGMLGRNVDIFGLQAQADQKSVQKSLIEKAQQELKRRNIPMDRIWDQNSDFWRDIMEDLSPEEYEYLMRLMQGVA